MSALEVQYARARLCNLRGWPLTLVDELALALSQGDRRDARGIC